MTSTTPESVIRQLVDAMRTLAGSHPGRPVHAKGMVCSGTSGRRRRLTGVTRAPHLQGQPVSTIIRFSNSSGNPDVHDGVPGVRSMAVKFQLSEARARTSWPTPSRGSLRGRRRICSCFFGLSSPIRQRVARAGRAAALSRRSPRRRRLRRAPDEEARAGELRSGELPRRARLSLHCGGRHQPVWSLSLVSSGGRTFLSPTKRASAARTSCARSSRPGLGLARPRSIAAAVRPGRRPDGRRHRRCGRRTGTWWSSGVSTSPASPGPARRTSGARVRPRQSDGRHRTLGRSDPAGPVGRLRRLVRAAQQG